MGMGSREVLSTCIICEAMHGNGDRIEGTDGEERERKGLDEHK